MRLIWVSVLVYAATVLPLYAQITHTVSYHDLQVVRHGSYAVFNSDRYNLTPGEPVLVSMPFLCRLMPV